jgi:hypothetical protein
MPRLNGADPHDAPSAPAGIGSNPPEQRRHKRRSAMWAAELETSGGERVSCIVLDISAGGAKLQLDHPLVKNEIVALITERVGAHWCRVAWRTGSRAGLEFLESHAEAPPPKQVGQDAKFLRGRAEVLRRLVQTVPSGDAAARLLHSAEEFDQAAAELERSQPAPSIRKEH